VSPRRRYLVTTVALLAVLLGYGAFQWRSERPAPPRPSRTAATRPAPLAMPPSAREVLARGAALSLTADQRARLEALASDWAKEGASLEAEVEAALAEFSRFMHQARERGKGASLQEVQQRMAEVSEPSARLRELRRLHAEAVARVLTDAQRGSLAVPSRAASGAASHVIRGGN
jgi:hypothetical protein